MSPIPRRVRGRVRHRAEPLMATLGFALGSIAGLWGDDELVAFSAVVGTVLGACIDRMRYWRASNTVGFKSR